MVCHRHLRWSFAVVLAVGMLGVAGPAATYSQFSDSQVVTDTVTTTSDADRYGPTAVATKTSEISNWLFTSIRLDGSESSSSDGSTLEYEWEVIEGPDCLRNPDQSSATCSTWSQPDTEIVITLTVTDGQDRFNSDTVLAYEPEAETASDTQTRRATAPTATPDEATPTAVSSPTATATPAPSETATETTTDAATTAPTTTATATQTTTPTAAETATVTETPIATETATVTETPTATATPTATETATVTETPTETETATVNGAEPSTETATPTETVHTTSIDTGNETPTPQHAVTERP